jgi:hypothetical protein
MAISDDPLHPVSITSSRNVVGALISIIQVTSSVLTIYRARERQLEIYGYAAFGLSVIPYAVMSIVNLLGTIACPEYTYLYIVHSAVLDEAVARGALVDGIVGTLATPTEGQVSARSRPGRGKILTCFHKAGDSYLPTWVDSDELPSTTVGDHVLREETKCERWMSRVALLVILFALVAPYAVIGGLTRFRTGQSSLCERAIMISWLVAGQVYGFLLGWYAGRGWYSGT